MSQHGRKSNLWQLAFAQHPIFMRLSTIMHLTIKISKIHEVNKLWITCMMIYSKAEDGTPSRCWKNRSARVISLVPLRGVKKRWIKLCSMTGCRKYLTINWRMGVSVWISRQTISTGKWVIRKRHTLSSCMLLGWKSMWCILRIHFRRSLFCNLSHRSPVNGKKKFSLFNMLAIIAWLSWNLIPAAMVFTSVSVSGSHILD